MLGFWKKIFFFLKKVEPKILADERSDFCCRFQIYLQKFIFLRKNVKKLDFFTHKGASRGMKKSRIFFRPLILGQKTFYYHERASRQWNFTEIFSPQSILDTPFQMYVIASVQLDRHIAAPKHELPTTKKEDFHPTRVGVAVTFVTYSSPILSPEKYFLAGRRPVTKSKK